MKRARRRPYVSLIPRKERSCYLFWNLGEALAGNPNRVEIRVGFLDPDDGNSFVTLKIIGPPQVSGGTFVNFYDSQSPLSNLILVAMVVQKPSSSDLQPPFLSDIYATSRPVRLFRDHSLDFPRSFVRSVFQYPLPLRIENLPVDILDAIFSFRLDPSALKNLGTSSIGASELSSHGDLNLREIGGSQQIRFSLFSASVGSSHSLPSSHAH